MRAKSKSWRSFLLHFLGRAVLLWLVFTVSIVLLFRFVPPPISTFMLARWFEGVVQHERKVQLRYQWGSWDRMTPKLALAVLAAEDQKFCQHRGFDWQAIRLAWHLRKRDGTVQRGASTISQQVAKNLFLWKGRNWLRKGMEAYFTLLIEQLWTKRRILEVYLNIAEFGDGVYGVQSAAKKYFAKTAANLNQTEAATLAAVLPNPQVYRVDKPSPYVYRKAQWIAKQMRQLDVGFDLNLSAGGGEVCGKE
jgi:monofunctional biosynthetic peptidoglycan transglycosylase